MSSRHFAQNYTDARAKFRAAAQAAGVGLAIHVNPNARGPDGEELTTDTAYFGAADAAALMITNSATHGAEGFCGSGCQIATIAAGLTRALPGKVAMLMIHAINPYGFAWLRRVTEDNVDLNRNFVDHAQPHPRNPGYGDLHGWLIPADWDGPARAAADKAIASFIAAKGMPAFQAAVSGGQYDHADGLFYGGRAPTWSNRTLHEILRRHGANRRRIGFIDYHTGLGPPGYGEPIFMSSPDHPGLARARQWYGADVTSPAAGTSTSAPLQGTIDGAFAQAAPKAELTAIALEYGTLPLLEVKTALRGDHWLHNRGDLRSALGREIKARMRAAFYIETDEWRDKVLARALDLTRKAIAALAA